MEAIFSFVFGDGDPNADFEERRWQRLADMIRAKSGVGAGPGLGRNMREASLVAPLVE